MPERDLPPLSTAQLEIMDIVWDRGETTVGEVHEILVERRGVARNTVQTVMTRLGERQWLLRRKVAGTYRYSAAVPRRTTLRRMVRQLVDTAFKGSADGLVMALLEGRGVSADEAESIRLLIDQSERRKGRR